MSVAVTKPYAGRGAASPAKRAGIGLLGVAALLALGMLLAGCASMPQWGPDDREKLVKASDSYNSLIRWHEFDKACVTHADESIRAKCLDRALVLKDVQVTNVRTRDIDFRIDGISATVHAEIEYYVLPSIKVRTILDAQQWVTTGPLDKKVWIIKSMFPDFVLPGGGDARK
jgi:hypothetical protein